MKRSRFLTLLEAFARVPTLAGKRRCLTQAPDWFIRDLVLLAEHCRETRGEVSGALARKMGSVGVTALAGTRRRSARQMRSTAIQHGGLLPILAVLAPLIAKAAVAGAASAGTGFLVKKALNKK